MGQADCEQECADSLLAVPCAPGRVRGIRRCTRQENLDSNAFYVAISRFLNGFITVNAVFALLSGSNEH